MIFDQHNKNRAEVTTFCGSVYSKCVSSGTGAVNGWWADSNFSGSCSLVRNRGKSTTHRKWKTEGSRTETPQHSNSSADCRRRWPSNVRWGYGRVRGQSSAGNDQNSSNLSPQCVRIQPLLAEGLLVWSQSSATTPLFLEKPTFSGESLASHFLLPAPGSAPE